MAFIICASSALGHRAEIAKDAIQVRIKLDKAEFHGGEVILFKVIISNVGTEPFLIPNRVSSSGSSLAHSELNFEVRNQSGKLVPGIGWAADCADYKPTRLALETILNDYLLLRPGTSFVQQTPLTGLADDLKAGTYHMKSIYSASFSPLGCQRWTAQDVEKFPFQAWYGMTAVNDISFTVLPATKK